MQYEVTGYSHGLLYYVTSPNGVECMVRANKSLRVGEKYVFKWGKRLETIDAWYVTVIEPQ